jgi:uncharacterized protein
MLLDLALQNLVSPATLFFILGLGSALVRSDLAVPDAIAKLLVIYLLISIGFRGGVELAHHGFDSVLIRTIAAGVALSVTVPFLAFALLRKATDLDAVDAATIAGHYGSISAVTFAAVTAALLQLGMAQEGFMVAVAAAMEAPAIFAALFLARRHAGAAMGVGEEGRLFRHVALNGSIVVLVGAFLIGTVVGQRGLMIVKPFFIDLFPGFLCLFLLDMGLIAGQGLLRDRRALTGRLLAFALLMPLVNAALALVLARLSGLSPGGTAVLMTLAASASYIAAPAALRLALPKANIALALSLSLCVTFPFNLLVGIPAYIAVAKAWAG